jgi:heme exporter protein D
MRYVIAGYVVVLAILFLYGVQLIWRRRRLLRAVARVEVSPVGEEAQVDRDPTSDRR